VNLSPPFRRLGNRGEIVRGLLVYLAAGAVAMAAIVHRHRLWAQPGFEEANVAIHLLRGDGFASPFYLGPEPAPPSAYCPPIYPLIIAGCYTVAPYHGGLLLLLINSACMGIVALAVYRLGRYYASIEAGICAVVLFLLHPSFLFYAGDLWDAFVSLAIFMWIVSHIPHLPGRGNPLFRSGLIGAAMGLLALTSPSYALSFPLIALVDLRGWNLKIKMKGIFVMMLAGGAVLAPWTLRNFELFHRVYFVRDELNFELFEGNLPFATGWMGSELRDENLYFNATQQRLVLSLGEGSYFDLCGRKFRREYDADPAAFWRRTARRIVYVFISDPTLAQLEFPLLPDIRSHGIVLDRLALHGFFAVGGIAGAWAAWRLRLGCVWIFFAGLLTTAPFLFCTVDDRYVLPFRAVLILFTSILLWAAWERMSRGHWPTGATRPVQNAGLESP
jgi:hypothetical protein